MPQVREGRLTTKGEKPAAGDQGDPNWVCEPEETRFGVWFDLWGFFQVLLAFTGKNNKCTKARNLLIHIQEIILVQTIQQGRLDSNETAWTGG